MTHKDEDAAYKLLAQAYGDAWAPKAGPKAMSKVQPRDEAALDMRDTPRSEVEGPMLQQQNKARRPGR